MKKIRLKKQCLFLLILILILILPGCGGKKDKTRKINNTTDTTQSSLPENTVATPGQPTALPESVPEMDNEGFYVANDYVETVGETINVRTEPSTDAKIYQLLPGGAVLKRTGYNAEWTRVLIDNINLYIHSDYVVETEPPVTEEPTEENEPDSDEEENRPKKIVIDPGNQPNANVVQEELGPGSLETKQGATIGAVGASTGVKEYDLNYTYAKSLKTELESRGYEVVLTRETAETEMSNKERAQFANSSGADLFIRIEMNYSANSELAGVMALTMTADSPYNSRLYTESNRLATRLLQGMVEKTGATNRGIYETNQMTGINWSNIPVTVLELGYLSNAGEEELLISDEYKGKMIDGIADGIDYYFAK